MKKILLYTICILLITACNNSNTNVTIKGDIIDFQKGTIYLEKESNGIIKKLDSIELDNTDQFRFNTHVDSTDLYWISIKKWQAYRIPVFAEKDSTISITVHKDSLMFPSVSGSTSSKKYQEFINGMRTLSDRENNFYNDYLKFYFSKKNALAADALNKSKKTEKIKSSYAVQFIHNNKEDMVSALVASFYLKDVNVSYLEKSFDIMSPNVQKSYYGQFFKNWITKVKNSTVGSSISPVKQYTANSTEITFPDEKNNLFVFWSMSKPESYNYLTKVHELTKDKKDINLVAVNIDSNPKLVNELLSKDSLSIQSVYDSLGYQNALYLELGVRRVPSNVLISKTGEILSRDYFLN